MTASPFPEIDVLSTPNRPCHVRVFGSPKSRTRGKVSGAGLVVLAAIPALLAGATAAVLGFLRMPQHPTLILCAAVASSVLVAVIIYFVAGRSRTPRDFWIEGDRFFWRHRRTDSLPLADIEAFSFRSVSEHPLQTELRVKLAGGSDRQVAALDDLPRPSAGWLEDELNAAVKHARLP
jgi:hypothetical protein